MNDQVTASEVFRHCDDHRYSVRPPPKFHPFIHPSIRLPSPAHQQTNDHQRHSFQPKRRNLIDPTNSKSHLTEALWSATKHTVAPYAPRYSSPPKESKWVQGRVVVGRSSLAILFMAWRRHQIAELPCGDTFSLTCSSGVWFPLHLCFFSSRFRYLLSFLGLDWFLFHRLRTSDWVRRMVICGHAYQTKFRPAKQARCT